MNAHYIGWSPTSVTRSVGSKISPAFWVGGTYSAYSHLSVVMTLANHLWARLCGAGWIALSFECVTLPCDAEVGFTRLRGSLLLACFRSNKKYSAQKPGITEHCLFLRKCYTGSSGIILAFYKKKKKKNPHVKKKHCLWWLCKLAGCVCTDRSSDSDALMRLRGEIPARCMDSCLTGSYRFVYRCIMPLMRTFIDWGYLPFKDALIILSQGEGYSEFCEPVIFFLSNRILISYRGCFEYFWNRLWI